MSISSRTPEGFPHKCPICGEIALLEPAYPNGDSVCPACGSLVLFIRDRVGVHADLSSTLKELGADSLDVVELIMELEEELDIEIPDDEAEQIHSIEDLIRWLRKNRPDL